MEAESSVGTYKTHLRIIYLSSAAGGPDPLFSSGTESTAPRGGTPIRVAPRLVPVASRPAYPATPIASGYCIAGPTSRESARKLANQTPSPDRPTRHLRACRCTPGSAASAFAGALEEAIMSNATHRTDGSMGG
ncbi:hypothetical protein B0H10DRAFT_2206515 [Mycena sp. CBHHK59/15]|nr:hypothetical protein B0H10DRAFT_2206515 [Mycena sp. CBHHK59/15]